MIEIYNLYNEKNIDAINNELDNIIEKVNIIKANNYEPTIKECFAIKKDIINYVKSNKRIIYGGTAWDELIKNKDPNDKIYNENDCNDVEFYSPKPIDDIVKLCKILNNKYKFVRAQEAQHPETYTIFVNFKAMCDITYMPSPIFYGIKKQTIKGIEYIHPSVILIDILRQYNDPINSYWRLKEKKVFFRANKILKHFPLQLENGKLKSNTNINKEIIEYVFLIGYVNGSLLLFIFNELEFTNMTYFSLFLNENPNLISTKQIPFKLSFLFLYLIEIYSSLLYLKILLLKSISKSLIHFILLSTSPKQLTKYSCSNNNGFLNIGLNSVKVSSVIS
jgi:hypothetical protein